MATLIAPSWSDTGAGPLPDFHAMAATAEGHRPIQKKDLLGHVWVADFFFVSCGSICPRMTSQMRKLQNRLPKDVWLVSFTVDPQNDTLADLEGYARDHHADAHRWLFLRMKKQPLAKLMYQGFKSLVTYQEPFDENAPISHNSRFFLIDAAGNLHDSYDGLDDASLDKISLAATTLLRGKN